MISRGGGNRRRAGSPALEPDPAVATETRLDRLRTIAAPGGCCGQRFPGAGVSAIEPAHLRWDSSFEKWPNSPWQRRGVGFDAQNGSPIGCGPPNSPLRVPKTQVMTTPHTTSRSRPDMMAVLEDRGYRSTAPRRAIIHILEGKQEGFTAEEIGSELPGVGRATIFRTIKLLMEVGVICRLNLLDGAPKYSLSRIEHHHHTVCVKCGVVGEFRATTVERLMRSLGNEIPGEIMGHRIELYVTCDRCASDESS